MTTSTTFPKRAALPEPRLLWIDTARGIGIILVVYAHALRGQVSAKLLAAGPIEQLQDHVIYAFHMPLFFFLSGLFAGTAIKSRVQFLQRRLITIVYPYLLWSIIQVLLSIDAHQFANRPATSLDLTQIAVKPIGQFWFLYVLAILQQLLLLPRPLFYLMVPVGIALGLYLGDGPILGRAGWDLPFFAAGVFVGARQMEMWLSSSLRAWVCLVASAGLFALLFLAPLPMQGAAGMTVRYALAGTGSAATLGLARLLGSKLQPLVTLGVASLPIFLFHVICAAAMRAGLVKLHVFEPEIALTLVTIAGLLIPLAAYEFAVRWNIAPLVGFGFPPARRIGSGIGNESALDTPLEPAAAKGDVGPTKPEDLNFHD